MIDKTDAQQTPHGGGVTETEMASELENLRPEVRDAWNHIIADEQYPADFECIRAELLRLAMIEADALIALDCEHDWQVEHKRAEKAEAELAALKARIAGAPIIHAEKTWRGTLFMNLSQHDVDLLDGTRVRLVVED